MEEKEENGSANMKRLQEETLTEQLECGREFLVRKVLRAIRGIVVSPARFRVGGWRHRACLGHDIFGAPGPKIAL